MNNDDNLFLEIEIRRQGYEGSQKIQVIKNDGKFEVHFDGYVGVFETLAGALNNVNKDFQYVDLRPLHYLQPILPATQYEAASF